MSMNGASAADLKFLALYFGAEGAHWDEERGSTVTNCSTTQD